MKKKKWGEKVCFVVAVFLQYRNLQNMKEKAPLWWLQCSIRGSLPLSATSWDFTPPLTNMC